MSMLTFYVNRAGDKLPKTQRTRLEKAKDELRELYGKPRQDDWLLTLANQKIIAARQIATLYYKKICCVHFAYRNL